MSSNMPNNKKASLVGKKNCAVSVIVAWTKKIVKKKLQFKCVWICVKKNKNNKKLITSAHNKLTCYYCCCF